MYYKYIKYIINVYIYLRDTNIPDLDSNSQHIDTLFASGYGLCEGLVLVQTTSVRDK